jgi:hypothetical protein
MFSKLNSTGIQFSQQGLITGVKKFEVETMELYLSFTDGISDTTVEVDHHVR